MKYFVLIISLFFICGCSNNKSFKKDNVQDSQKTSTKTSSSTIDSEQDSQKTSTKTSSSTIDSEQDSQKTSTKTNSSTIDSEQISLKELVDKENNNELVEGMSFECEVTIDSTSYSINLPEEVTDKFKKLSVTSSKPVALTLTYNLENNLRHYEVYARASDVSNINQGDILKVRLYILQDSEGYSYPIVTKVFK